MLQNRLILLFSILIFGLKTLPGQISGIVFSDEGFSLPAASILVLPDSLLLTTDEEGRFFALGLKDGSYQVRVSYLGYEAQEQTVEIKNQSSKSIKVILKPSSELLETIVITEEHAKQEGTLSSEHISRQLIEQNLKGTFARSIEKLPGISAINVGVGIAKPVIRGLSANRIIVNNNGIKQESQQWGTDHGLELDQFDVDRVEIIKGPASLQYGSDGLGGVINIMPETLPARNSFNGSILGVYKTNNQHFGSSAHIGMNLNDNFLTGRFSYQSFADYVVPADQFIYNSYTLPIYNRSLKNTAGKEQNLRLSAGINRKWGISRLNFSHYSLKAGLFSGAVGIPRSYALTEDGDSRDLDVPKQEVDHYKLAFNQSVFWEDHHFILNVGLQRNLRKEFSFPEFHSIPSSEIDPNNTLALELDLYTLSANMHLERHTVNDWKNVYGINFQYQDNRRAGFEFLLPDFRVFRSGGFFLAEKEFRRDFSINGGLRLDYGSNKSDFFQQLVWDSNEQISDTLLAPATDDPFFNWSASAGASWQFSENKWQLKANIGKSFRLPYPAETVSNGIHHGTFRHEKGTPGLQSEHGFQFDLGLDWRFDKFTGNLSAYFNYFKNYIYLGPIFPAQFSPLPEAGQIYQYRQDDAFYSGFELQWNWEVFEGMILKQAADFVQSYNISTGIALPFTPPPSLKTDVSYQLPGRNWMKLLTISLEHEYHLPAEGRFRIDRSEDPTPGYQLWNIGLAGKVGWLVDELQFNIKVQNIFDSSYLNHLSRYRIINVPEQGRDIVLSIKIPFSGKLKN